MDKQRDNILYAAINCAHEIEADKITLYRDENQDGNALNQLGKRLSATLSQQESGEKPVVYLRFRAAQIWGGRGDIDHNEWFETCHAHEVGDDKEPAFPVYTRPATQHSAPTELPPLPEPDATTDVNGKVVVRYFSELKVVEYAHAALSARAAQAVAAVPVLRIDLKCGDWLEWERKTSGDSGWLLRDKNGSLIRALNRGEVLLVDAALSATAHPSSATPKGAEPSEQDKLDADRYRWLRDKARTVDWSEAMGNLIYRTHCRNGMKQMDKAIDAAIQATAAQGKT